MGRNGNLYRKKYKGKCERSEIIGGKERNRK